MRLFDGLCPQCRTEPSLPNHAYCRDCRNAYHRQRRRTRPLEGDALDRARARNYAGTYLRRGKLTKLPCEVCQQPAEMHHDDYEQPLVVRWLCRPHHRGLHRTQETILTRLLSDTLTTPVAAVVTGRH